MTNKASHDESLLDLGTVDEPVLVFGGPYSNLQATQAVMTVAKQRSIPPHRMICTGDVVAYCANPVETITELRDVGVHVVMGNCEESLGFRQEDCGCGFEENTACDILSRQWYAYTDRLLSDDDRAWLRTRPRQISARMAGRSLAFIHGSVPDISGWVFQSDAVEEKARVLDTLGCEVVIAGHCGIPFTHELPEKRLWVNAGVIGMPANDGTQRGWFATITPKDDTLDVRLEPLLFDAEAAAGAMRDAGLADAYAKALESGLWPNMDVLPATERGHQGIELKEKTAELRRGD